MQKAALCRMVLVTVDPHANNGSDVAVAVIVRVFSDICVNLRVFRDGPDVAWLTSIPLYPSREAMEQARERRILDGFMTEGTVWHAAYWPPRDAPVIHQG